MSSPPQSITEWAQSRLNILYEHPAADPDSGQVASLESQIQALFSPNAQIYLNHTAVSVEEFTKQMGQTFGTNKTEVEWKDSMEIVDPDDDKSSSEIGGKTGIFAGYLIVTRTLKFMIRASPAKNLTTICLSAKIARDPEGLSDSSNSGSGNDTQGAHPDNRRIVQLFYTSVGKAAPVHLGIQR